MDVGDKDGFGRYGILDGDGQRIICHECGAWKRSFAGHLQTHDLNADEYKKRHGLPRGLPLVADDVRAVMSKNGRERVGSESWKKFESRRDPTSASHARGADAFTMRGVAKQAHIETAKRNINGVRKPRRPCVVCGDPCVPHRAVPTCSDLCQRVARYRRSKTSAKAIRWRALRKEGRTLTSIAAMDGCTHVNVRLRLQRLASHMGDVEDLQREKPQAKILPWERQQPTR